MIESLHRRTRTGLHVWHIGMQKDRGTCHFTIFYGCYYFAKKTKRRYSQLKQLYYEAYRPRFCAAYYLFKPEQSLSQ